MIDTCLKDTIVLIIDANYGISAATAVAFAKEKAKVFFEVSRHKKNQLRDCLACCERSAAIFFPPRNYNIHIN